MKEMIEFLFDPQGFMRFTHDCMVLWQGSNKPIEPEAFATTLQGQWLSLRDAAITFWAERVAETRSARLLLIKDRILSELEATDADYYLELVYADTDWDDGEEMAWGLGFALAVLRWRNLTNSGRVPEEFVISEAKAREWLALHGNENVRSAEGVHQPSLFSLI